MLDPAFRAISFIAVFRLAFRLRPSVITTPLRHMRAALLGILASAGFEVEEPDGHGHGHGHGSMVHVRGLRS